MAAMTSSILLMRVAAVPKRVAPTRRVASAAVRAVRPCTVVAKAAGAGAGKALEKASAVIPAAALSAAVFLTTAGPAHAELPVAEAKQFLEAFWKFRTGDATSFVCLTILPILGPYVIFQFFIDKKKLRHKATLAEGKWDVFMAERGLNVDILALPQLNAFVSAAENNLLDDEMVVEFVRQLEINEKWKKSTIDAQDPRMEAAKLRARAEKILAMKEARANETETTNAQ
eukprot:CAMPEP_0181377308 /NCGR_PEP_ID=MMETSP1106-20121128/17826_1 /TAXON_ID=81844 /ORGANISM="Mantoniella antarctica, Strain SL-175" /LENGTH=228 /DNA_ID=CAMNT_0023496031 /DNA_START=35 /DNA_END=721 /DNA_ORIENTATION=-